MFKTELRPRPPRRAPGTDRFDVAVVGAGIAGLATATRLSALGLSTVLLEAHSHVGGCAGYFARRGFGFDVGATTLVDFGPDGVGGEWLSSIGLALPPADTLPGYVAWLPDRTVVLHRDPARWARERLRMLGDSEGHRRLWRTLDRLAQVFWRVARQGARLPIRSPAEALRALRLVGLGGVPLLRYLRWTLGDLLRACGLRGEAPLAGLLSMLVEDTVHGEIDSAPLVNCALGITIRGAGLTRVRGGMRGFLRAVVRHYRAMGGVLRLACPVEACTGREGAFTLRARSCEVRAARVVSALPAALTARIAPPAVGEALAPFLRRDREAEGGALALFLGVPEEEVLGQEFTHHQIMQSYDAPLGNGNNMFLSVSAAGDRASAPPGFRAVMVSTHCDLDGWSGLDEATYARKKREAGAALLGHARRVYPRLGDGARVFEVATPRTYERFTGRPRGAVGGVRQTMRNSNQFAIPHDVGVPGFHLVGDSTWPGLGTVACVLGSRLVAADVLRAEAARA